MQAQYVLNMLSVNPGYAGYRDKPVLALFHRSQWVGFDGAPSTQVLTFDSRLKKDELGIGGTIMFDRVGPTSALSLTANGAYHLQLDRRRTLSFGLKGTMTLYQMNLADLDLISDYEGTEDEFFLANPKNLMLPNAGAGVFYYTQRSFIGLSAPKILRNQLDKRHTTAYSQMEGKEEPTLYLAAGKLWRLDRDYQFQPTIMIKATNNAPLSAGFYANLYIFDAFRVGVFYHLNEVAGALFQYEYEGKWKFGYSVDVAANRLIQTNYGSHELMLSYSLAPKRKRIIYPRYF